MQNLTILKKGHWRRRLCFFAFNWQLNLATAYEAMWLQLAIEEGRVRIVTAEEGLLSSSLGCIPGESHED